MKVNLNAVIPDCDGGIYKQPRSVSCVASIGAFVDDLPERLIERLKDADLVVGCMAWLTQRDILRALAEVKYGCQLVVQKEDFIRPGVIGRHELHVLYSKLHLSENRYGLPAGASNISVCGDPSCEPVRCMGVVAESPRATIPRMHHKFFVFCRRVELDPATHDPFPYRYEPYATWTGSFNATQNATMSRENAVYIASPELAEFYAREWCRVLALSEPLNWEWPEMDGQWRFGT